MHRPCIPAEGDHVQLQGAECNETHTCMYAFPAGGRNLLLSSTFDLLSEPAMMVEVYVCVCGGGGGGRPD